MVNVALSLFGVALLLMVLGAVLGSQEVTILAVGASVLTVAVSGMALGYQQAQRDRDRKDEEQRDVA